MPSGYDPIVNQTFYWDDRGYPYQLTGSGKRSYPSPLVAAQYRTDPKLVEWARKQGVVISNDGRVTDTGSPNATLFGGAGVWNQQEGKWDIPRADALYGLGVGALVGGGIANAIKGGGAAAAATQNAGAGAGAGTTAAAEGLIPATFSSPAGMTVPVATQGTAAGLGSVPVAAGAGATSFLDKVKNAISDPSNIAGLAATIPAIASAAGGGNNGPMSDPTVQELLKMNLKRQQRTDPLHESVTQLSMAMLPTAYQRRG